MQHLDRTLCSLFVAFVTLERVAILKAEVSLLQASYSSMRSNFTYNNFKVLLSKDELFVQF